MRRPNKHLNKILTLLTFVSSPPANTLSNNKSSKLNTNTKIHFWTTNNLALHLIKKTKAPNLLSNKKNTKVQDTKEMMTLAGEEEDDLGFLLFWATILMFEEKAKAGDNIEMAFISLLLE